LFQDTCPITADSFASAYLNLVEEMEVVDQENGKACTIPSNKSIVGKHVSTWPVSPAEY